MCLILFGQSNAYSKWLGYVSHCQPQSLVHLLKAQLLTWSAKKISFFFHWKAQSFHLMKHQKLIQSHFLIFNKVQNIRQYNLIFDYAQMKILFLEILTCSILRSSSTVSSKPMVNNFDKKEVLPRRN